MLFTLSSRLVLGLTRLLVPLIYPNMTSSSLTTCPKHLKAACATLDSSVQSGLVFSSIHTLVFLSIHDTLINRLQHHISNASSFFFSASLIAQVSPPHSRLTIGNTMAFTSFTFVASLIPLSCKYIASVSFLVSARCSRRWRRWQQRLQ